MKKFKTKEYHKHHCGFVYCCIVYPNESAPYLKIGYSSQPDLRASQLESNSKLSCSLLDVWQCESQSAAKALEYEVHQHLNHYKHQTGYWTRESFRRGCYSSLQAFMRSQQDNIIRVYKNSKIVIES